VNRGRAEIKTTGTARAVFFTACVAVFSAVAAGPSTRFEIGGCNVDLFSSKANVAPVVTFGGRTMQFAYRTDGILFDGEKSVPMHSFPTNGLAVLRETAREIRAEYVHTLYIGAETNATVVGTASNEVVFVAGGIGVRVTLYPEFPGRYRFRWKQKASQVIVFPEFKKWIGTTLESENLAGFRHMNLLPPHSEFDPHAWGMNTREAGEARKIWFGNVPDVWTLSAAEGAAFTVNHYTGGFELGAVALNEDAMHTPAWDRPFTYNYAIRLEK
jgi:hypothetical protein